MGSADTASPSGMSSKWCSWANAWPARQSSAATLKGRDMADVPGEDVDVHDVVFNAKCLRGGIFLPASVPKSGVSRQSFVVKYTSLA